jgi:hypothetical protein
MLYNSIEVDKMIKKQNKSPWDMGSNKEIATEYFRSCLLEILEEAEFIGEVLKKDIGKARGE